MPHLDVHLPTGFSLTSYAERPDLIPAANTFNSSVWPDFMLQDADADKYWNSSRPTSRSSSCCSSMATGG